MVSSPIFSSDGASVNLDQIEESEAEDTLNETETENIDEQELEQELDLEDDFEENGDSQLALTEPTANPPLPKEWPQPGDRRWNVQTLPVLFGQKLRKDRLSGHFYICDGRLYVFKEPPLGPAWTSYILGHCHSKEAYKQLAERLRVNKRLSELRHLERFWDDKRPDHPYHRDERPIAVPIARKRNRSPEDRPTAQHHTSELSSRGRRSRTPSAASISSYTAHSNNVAAQGPAPHVPVLTGANLMHGIETMLAERKQMEAEISRLQGVEAKMTRLSAEWTRDRELIAKAGVQVSGATAAENRNDGNSGEVTALRAKIELLSEESTRHATEASALKETLAQSATSAKAKLEELETQYHAARNDLQHLTNESSQSAAKSEQLKQQHEMALKEIVDSKKQAETAKVEAETMKQQVETAKVEAETMKQQVETAKAEAETMKQQVEIAKAEAETMKQQVEIAKAEAETMKQQVDIAKAEAETMKQQVEIAKAEAETMKQRVETVHTQCTTAVEENTRQEAENKDLKQRLTLIQRKHDQLAASAETAATADKQKLESVTTENINLTKHLESLRLENGQLVERLKKDERLENDNRTLRQRVQQLLVVEKQLAADVNKYSHAATKLVDEVKTLRTANQKHESDLQRIQEKALADVAVLSKYKDLAIPDLVR